jgi:hypothetical protein
MNARLLALLLSLPLVALAAPSPEPPGSGKYYKTPQAVFDASGKAAEKKDYKTVIDCIAPESRKEMAAQLALQALALKGVPSPRSSKANKALTDVLDKHGLTEKAIKDIKVGHDTASMRKARADLAKLIKKPEAFAVEMMAANAKAAEAMLPPGVTLPKVTMKLEGVKVEGKKATGTMVGEATGLKYRLKVGFVKGTNGWRMLPTLDTEGITVEGGPVAPPRPPGLKK